MKLNSLIVILIIFTFSSCELQGVKDKKVNLNDTIIVKSKVDSAFIEMEQKLVQPIKSDSVEGVKNDMVWTNSDGLRIEWEIKKDKNQIEINDVVFINYEARVSRGEVYDSNNEIKKPVPVKLGIGQLIKGWELGLLQMHEGDKGRIMIPSKLAYGKNGYLGKVPQDADVIIEIEILNKVKPILLEEGVKVFIYKKSDTINKLPIKNQKITFDYFAYKKGKKPGMYDNSYQRGTSFTTQYLNDNIVDGLHQGLSVLRANEHAFIDIPYKLAYGKKGMQDLVPSNTDIVYDIRISSIK